MAEILIGTCGYSYREWIGPFYPERTQQTAFLGFYSCKFPTVELDYAYYQMPTAEQLERIAESGPGLTFAIKAYQSLTHKINAEKWPDDVETYLKAIEPLRKTGHLQAVLFQFPYSFHYETENRLYLDRLLTAFNGVPSAVEFRNADWCNNRVVEGLTKKGAALVSLDMPDLKGLPSVMDVVTGPFAYMRLHGRKGDSWWGSDSAARYDYLYSDSELEGIAERIKRIVVKADRVLVYFNNHRRGQAVQNAETLKKILEKAGLPVILGPKE